jgi:hypothetical protein
MSMVGFPLLLIPLAIYNIIVFLMPGVSLTETLVSVPLTSGAEWPVTLSDVLLAIGILMLLLEVVKGARPGAKYLTDHLLSLIVLGGAIAEFLLWPRFANSTFFLLALLALTEFFSGIALHVKRAPIAAGAARGTRREVVEVRREPADFHASAPPPASEPVSDAAASHGPMGHEQASHEPVNHAPAEPTFSHPETTTVEPAAETHPAESKPGHDEPRPPEAAH